MLTVKQRRAAIDAAVDGLTPRQIDKLATDIHFSSGLVDGYCYSTTEIREALRRVLGGTTHDIELAAQMAKAPLTAGVA